MKIDIKIIAEKLTDFLTNDTNPYPLDFNVWGSRTTRQSLKIRKKNSVFITRSQISFISCRFTFLVIEIEIVVLCMMKEIRNVKRLRTTNKTQSKSKLNHHNGLTKCLQTAGKLLSTFAFQFLVRDRQQKCDSVLPRMNRIKNPDKISLQNYKFYD